MTPPSVIHNSTVGRPRQHRRSSTTAPSVIHDGTVGRPQQHRRSSTTAPSVIHDSTVGRPQQHRWSSTTAPLVVHNSTVGRPQQHRRSSTTAPSVVHNSTVGRPQQHRRSSTTAPSVIHNSTVRRDPVSVGRRDPMCLSSRPERVVAWTGGAVVKTDARVINARAVDAETGARFATTGPSVRMTGKSVAMPDEKTEIATACGGPHREGPVLSGGHRCAPLRSRWDPAEGGLRRRAVAPVTSPPKELVHRRDSLGAAVSGAGGRGGPVDILQDLHRRQVDDVGLVLPS
jgi:hypothetical protein